MNHHARCATSPSCLRARNANNQARICSHIKEHSDLLVQLTCSRHENREGPGRHAVTYLFWPWKTGLPETLVKVDRLPMQSDGISEPWNGNSICIDLRHLYMRLTPVCGKSDCSETRHLIDFSWTTLHWSCSSHELFQKEQPPTLVASQLSRKRQNSNHWEDNLRRKQPHQSCRTSDSRQGEPYFSAGECLWAHLPGLTRFYQLPSFVVLLSWHLHICCT